MTTATLTRRSLLAAGLGGLAAAAVGVPADAATKIKAAPNFRPINGVRRVWRSDDLDGINAADKAKIRRLGITLMVAMNTGRDPHIPGVANRKHVVSKAGSMNRTYRRYVSNAKNRRAIGRVLLHVAYSRHGVIVHCKAGKDRTGWVSDILQRLAGVPREQRDSDYLATRRYSGGSVNLHWLNAARAQLVDDYGTVYAYLRACGLTNADIRHLMARL